MCINRYITINIFFLNLKRIILIVFTYFKYVLFIKGTQTQFCVCDCNPCQYNQTRRFTQIFLICFKHCVWNFMLHCHPYTQKGCAYAIIISNGVYNCSSKYVVTYKWPVPWIFISLWYLKVCFSIMFLNYYLFLNTGLCTCI